MSFSMFQNVLNVSSLLFSNLYIERRIYSFYLQVPYDQVLIQKHLKNRILQRKLQKETESILQREQLHIWSIASYMEHTSTWNSLYPFFISSIFSLIYIILGFLNHGPHMHCILNKLYVFFFMYFFCL